MCKGGGGVEFSELTGEGGKAMGLHWDRNVNMARNALEVLRVASACLETVAPLYLLIAYISLE